jgi:predicted alpha/beta-fold hydrolase
VWDFDPRVTALARYRNNCTVNYRPVLSSKRLPHIKKPTIVRKKTKNLVMGCRWEPDTKTD